MEENVTVMMVPLDELLGYYSTALTKAPYVASLRSSLKRASFDLSRILRASSADAQYFADEYCRWEYDIPNAIKRVAYGEAWKEKTMVERRGDD